MSDMQDYYDRCLPGNSFVLNDYDRVTMRLVDNVFNVEPCTLTMSKADPVDAEMKLASKNFLKPLIRTAVEKPRVPGLLENLVAMIKRNFNSPDLAGIIDTQMVAGRVVDKFFDDFFTDDGIKHIDSCKYNKYLYSKENLSVWYDKQQPQSVGQLANADFIDFPGVDEYKHMIKTQPKGKLDNSIQTEYPALQTIVYHSKHVNSIFGPIFSEYTRILLESIDTNKFFFYTRKTVDELEGFFSDLTDHSNMDVLELDISKYDKSQNDFHFCVEMKIWERLGIDSFLKQVWESGHKRTTLKDFQAGIKTIIYHQRKSGDVTTFIGNTLIIAACVSSLLPIKDCIKAAFCGDDSVIYFKKGLDFSCVQSNANLMWNFEAKLFKKTYGYFCGKYIIHHSGGCIIYPDPLKLIQKLGNKSLTSREHAEEFRVSLCDVSRNLGNCAYFDLLDKAIAEVFKQAGGGSYAFNAFWKYITNPALFKNLYDDSGPR